MYILHLTTSREWREAQKEGEYRAVSLETEGFIHCSTDNQLLPVANAFYRDVKSPVVLWIDSEKLQAPLRWEAPAPADEFKGDHFPHIYGPLNLEAVVRISVLKRDEAGTFVSF